MNKLVWTGLAAGALALGISAPALSHHSHAMFDHATEVTIEGTVSEFSYRNPHVFLYVDVAEQGEAVKYWIEMSNIPNMIRRGIGANTFKSGDQVTVNMNPLTDGRPGGNYVTIVAADGNTYD
jgi:hypothetical protein